MISSLFNCCKQSCDQQISKFIEICSEIRFPVSMEKTFWGTTKLSFLGLLIDTISQLICVPIEKINKARTLISHILDKKSKNIELQQLQQITGFLNFLGKAVIPGRAFTRRLYCIEDSATRNNMKKHHHIKVRAEMRMDLETWLHFLDHPTIYARKFLDMDINITSEDVDFYTDASANPQLGCGGICEKDWFIQQWDEEFIKLCKPSINYLELYAMTVAILSWIHKFQNKRIFIFCDNMSVVQMVNNTTSKCKNCMVLIRIIVLQALTNNVKINVKHVPGKLNKYSDWLSRLEYRKFWQHAKQENRKFSAKTTTIPQDIWPMDKIWLNEKYQKVKLRNKKGKHSHSRKQKKYKKQEEE